MSAESIPKMSVSDTNPPIHPARVLVPLGLGTALSLMGDATLYTVLPTHTVDAGIALGSVGIILGVNRAIRVLLNGPAGLLYDRLPRRWLFVPALFIGALSTAIYAATQGFWPLFVGRLLWGLAWSGIWVGGATMILDVTTVRDRGRWTGLYQVWFALGAGLGAFAGGLLTDWIGYTATMWVGATLTACGGFAALFALPETHTGRRAAARSEHSSRVDRGVWAAALLQGINRFVTAGVLAATMGLLVQERLRPAEIGVGVATLSGVLMAGRMVFGMAASSLSGTLSDRLGSRWRVLLLALAMGAASLFLLAQQGAVIVLLGVTLAAAAGGGVQTLVTALAGDMAGKAQRGRSIGLLYTAGDLGSALGPPVAYALLPILELSGVYLLCAGLFALGAVLAWRYRGR
jgi:MFS family permease